MPEWSQGAQERLGVIVQLEVGGEGMRADIAAVLAELDRHAERIPKLEMALHHAINRTHDFSQGCTGCSDGTRLLVTKK